MSWITISILIMVYMFSGFKYLNFEYKNKYKVLIDKIMYIYLIPYYIIIIPIFLLYSLFTGKGPDSMGE